MTDELLKEAYDLFPLVCQLLDGWHADGTAWTDWDESIRRRCSELHLKLFWLFEPEKAERLGLPKSWAVK